ncbi:hypothetical protein [Paraburkholderia terricola]|uniref:hypothetical protein n=1 Tax=Paraburkholderia terricola TaxID=169427 RepID=UPI00285B8961|nr:hypothetical protein [Paraburkholderia terricola]MDR6481104.1 hypothetical protein [Paraburkholderia terricola]
MKHITTRPKNEGRENEADNVYSFPSRENNALCARQNAIREHLLDLAEQTERSPPIAAATVLLRADGTVGVAAKGIDPEIAACIADELNELSNVIRRHAHRSRRARSLQRGFFHLAPAISIAFLVATYINTNAWLDVALMLISQVTVGPLLAKQKPHKSRSG